MDKKSDKPTAAFDKLKDVVTRTSNGKQTDIERMIGIGYLICRFISGLKSVAAEKAGLMLKMVLLAAYVPTIFKTQISCMSLGFSTR